MWGDQVPPHKSPPQLLENVGKVGLKNLFSAHLGSGKPERGQTASMQISLMNKDRRDRKVPFWLYDKTMTQSAKKKPRVKRNEDMDKEQALEKHSKIYEPGTVLFYEGDPASKLWVINEGRIQISKRVFTEEIVLEILGPGEFCGELSLVTDAPQAVTATVIEPARLLVIDATQFEAMIRANGELSMRMMRKLAGRLNEAQFLVSALQMRNTIGRVMLHLKREIENSGTGKVSVPSDLAKMLGLDDVELEDIMDRLVAKKLIKLSGDNVCEIVNNAEYSRYLNYLELRDRYDFFDK